MLLGLPRMSTVDFIDSFCVYSSWDSDLWFLPPFRALPFIFFLRQGAPLAEWTPCFEDVVMLGSVHIVVQKDE